MKVEAPFQGFTEQVDSMLQRVLTRKSEENSNKIVLIFSKYQGKRRGGRGVGTARMRCDETKTQNTLLFKRIALVLIKKIKKILVAACAIPS